MGDVCAVEDVDDVDDDVGNVCIVDKVCMSYR